MINTEKTRKQSGEIENAEGLCWGFLNKGWGNPGLSEQYPARIAQRLTMAGKGNFKFKSLGLE